MNCYCGSTVRCVVSKTGALGYTCAVGKCRFFAMAPVQADGCRRILPSSPGSADDVVVVRFEAVLHPESKTTHVAATLSTHGVEAVLAVLEDTRFQPMWHVAKEAYLYPMDSYSGLVAALKQVLSPRVLVEEIPPFFFRCLNAAQELLLQHEKNMDAELSQSADVEDVVYSQLRPFQKKGVDFIIARGGRGMIADDMGLGKTVQALAVAHHYRDEWPVLIVCPLSLVENWAKEFVRFCSIPLGRIAILQASKVRVMDVHSVVIVPYSSLKSLETVSTVFKVVILDESHYIKTVDSKRTTAALKICRAARRVLLLSGTPTLSRPIELYPQLQAVMHPSWTPTKTQFGARYCNAFVGRFGVDYTGHSNMSELHVLLQHFVIRRTKRELGSELPSKSRQLLYVYITPKEKKALEGSVLALRNSFKNDAALPSAGGDSANPFAMTSATPNNASSRVGNAFDLKIATARAKIAAVQDYVKSTAEQMVESGQKVIIFAHHQCMMEAIREAVESVQPKQPLDYIYITGETPGTQREALTTHFRTAPNCHIAVLSMHSCGVGYNLTCASMVVFAELDWNPSTHQQCEDRVHRMGQSSACVIKYLLAEGTSDSVIWPMLQSKLTVTHAVLEDTTTGSDGLCADVGTQRVCRSDVCLTPSSHEKKQKNLMEFLTGSGSRSRPATQHAEDNEDLQKSPCVLAPAGDLQCFSRKSQSAGAVDTVLLDVATLRQQRAARRTHAVAPASSAKCVDLLRTAAATSNAVPQQLTLREVVGNSPPDLVASKGVSEVSGVLALGTMATTVPGEQTTVHSASVCLSGRVASSSASAARRTPFGIRVAPSICPSSSPCVASGGAVAPTPVVTPVATASSSKNSGDGNIRLVPAPRSEEIRRYNARRTLFTVGSLENKRLRLDDGEGPVP